MKKTLLCTLLLGMLSIAGFGQSDNFWSPSNASRSSITTAKAVARHTFPEQFKLFNLNFNGFTSKVMSIVDSRSANKSTIISLPNAEGELEQFEIYEASNFDPAVQARYPQIRAYSGRGITDKYATLKLSVSPQGIQTMVFRAGKDDEFMEPYSQDHMVYAVYSSQRTKGSLPWNCSTVEQSAITGLGKQIHAMHLTNRSGGDLKTMRLAQSVTAEYSNYFGATAANHDTSLVLAGINATLARCNGVYEKDLALHLNMIPQSTSVIYFSSSTDPYSPASTGAAGNWNGELQNTLTSVIGDANYDIGHLFGASGGGGNAGCIGCICSSGKGSGFTSPADGIPQGDNFDIDYVVHEVGHQLGANHTFSMSNEGSGVNKEVGSGITIMGYAGITSYNVAAHSIDIYHEASIAQIQANFATKTCPVTYTIVNATPVVAPVSNYTIPKSTPFALTGSATDADGDPLTYCWEEDDNASSSQANANSSASVTKASGPNWVSFPPTTSPTRLFPRLATILTGGVTTGPLAGGTTTLKTEALSSVARTLKFRLTVRDNHPFSQTAPYNVGQTQFTDMTVTVSAAAGPFTITSPNTAVTWTAGTCQTVVWSVANTNLAPINCSNVNIELSTDTGRTFTMLAANVPNTGTAQVAIPSNINTTTARIKVSAVGNIFFDIDNANFSIVPASYPQYSMCAPAAAGACENTAANSVINTNSLAGFTSPITFSATGNPAGTTVTFTPNPVAPGSPVTVTMTGTFAAGTYTLNVSGTGDTITRSVDVVFNVVPGTVAPVMTSPADGTTGVSTSPTFSWQAATNATGYNIEIANNPAFTSPIVSTTVTGTSYTPTVVLQEDAEYWWRVSANNACGAGPISTAAHFKTGIAACDSPVMSTDVPVAISASGAPLVTSTLNIPTPGGSILDVDVIGLNITHTWDADLGIQLQHGTGASHLWEHNCDDNNQYQNFDISYDDEATITTAPCPPTGGVTVQPMTPLSVFDGMNSSGTWTLRVKDTADVDGGSINAWGLRICTFTPTAFPVNWLSFTGHKNENRTVTLQWSTATELNNHHYDIERSSDGVHFSAIGTMRAGTNPAGIQNYYFNDMKPYTGANYYRLKQVDRDGRFEYSRIVKITIDKSATLYAVYPNPATDKSTVRVLSDMNQLTLRMTDNAGRVVYQRTIGAAKTGQEFAIPVSGLSKGVYVLTLATENGTSNEKVIVE